MNTAWSAFNEWRQSRERAKNAVEEMATALESTAKHEESITDLLRRHGPITHDNHVYFLVRGCVACEPFKDSFNLTVEETK